MAINSKTIITLSVLFCAVSVFSEDAELWKLFGISHEYCKKGSYSKSIETAKKALSIAKKEYSPEHLYVAIALNYIANGFRGNGDSADANNYFDKALGLTNEIISTKDKEIKVVLSQTYEVAQHNMNGASGNVVYLHKDGHQEAVFDKNGNAVTDPANKASFNIAHPVNEPFKHFQYDTWQWIRFGNGPEDPTHKYDRLTAFHSDLLDGFKKASKH